MPYLEKYLIPDKLCNSKTLHCQILYAVIASKKYFKNVCRFEGKDIRTNLLSSKIFRAFLRAKQVGEKCGKV